MENAPVSPNVYWNRPPNVWPPARRKLGAMLLPKGAMSAWVVLLGWVLPQALLIPINLAAWHLGAGDASESNRFYAGWLFGGQLLSLAAGVATVAWLAFHRTSLTRWMGAIPLGFSALFLGFVLPMAEKAIPSTLTDWMLPVDQWMLRQFALAMPAALLGAFRLACPDREDSGDDVVPGILSSIGMMFLLIGVAVGYLPLIGALTQAFRVDSLFSVPVSQIFLIGSYITLATLAAAGLLRVTISYYVWTRTLSPLALAIFTFLVAFAGPLGGLALNLTIPFPYDFHILAVYVLAAVNGLVLMLPNLAHPVLHRVVWLAQCALFPFTAYFFIVFLPFLSLGPLAILVFALGVLMYVPTMLFLLHGHRILDGLRHEAKRLPRGVATLLATAAILAWPVAYTVQAVRDRTALRQALDYLQYPNYAQNSQFPGGLPALQSALFHLRDFKQGFYLPLLSEYYNWLVFDNMVLPQEQLEQMHQTFFGTALPKSTARANPDFFGGGRTRWQGRSVTEVMSDAQTTAPSGLARLERLESVSKTEGHATRTKATLTVSNPTSSATEYRATLTVPPGVAVSGLWLTINGERVPGRIFEKRAAQWVYQKITEAPVRRDPAFLRYSGPGQLELSVYPVEPDASRTVEVEFLYPEGSAPDIRVGESRVQTPPAGASTASLVYAADGNFAVNVPASAAAALRTVTRAPYLHLIVDASRDSSLRDPAQREAAVARALASFPGVEQVRVTFANYESADFRQGALLSAAEAPAAIKEARPDFHGGFLPYRTVKEILWQHQLRLSQGDSPALKSYPQIVVLVGQSQPLPKDRGNLAEFARLAPDGPGFWCLSQNLANLDYVALDPAAPQAATTVRIYQASGQRFVAPAEGPAAFTSLQPASEGAERTLEAYDSGAGKFTPVSVANASGLEPAIRPWSIELGRIFEPFRQKAGDLGALLRVCRETGILVPSAAYMVVENQAQWRILEQTEKKTLKGHESLALSETTPEPATVGLLIVAGAFFLWQFFLRRLWTKYALRARLAGWMGI